MEPDNNEVIAGLSVAQLLQGHRRTLARAITLIESEHLDHQVAAQQLLQLIMPHTGKSKRIGISGSPGVGKSSFIETLGLHLVEEKGHQVAVLAVDPSSPVAGGSILGDKTRMESLSRHPSAFIRPSPAGKASGGVAQRTREVLLLCEAAGFDVCIVETVGVGQSEYEVANMVDFFLVLLLPSAGDELQGIKRGIIELANTLVITKDDGEHHQAAQLTRQHYKSALQLLHHLESWSPQVTTSSIKCSDSILDVWNLIAQYFDALGASGVEQKRSRQNKTWMWRSLNYLVEQHLVNDELLSKRSKELQQAVGTGSISSFQAAKIIFNELLYQPK